MSTYDMKHAISVIDVISISSVILKKRENKFINIYELLKVIHYHSTHCVCVCVCVCVCGVNFFCFLLYVTLILMHDYSKLLNILVEVIGC